MGCVRAPFRSETPCKVIGFIDKFPWPPEQGFIDSDCSQSNESAYVVETQDEQYMRCSHSKSRMCCRRQFAGALVHDRTSAHICAIQCPLTLRWFALGSRPRPPSAQPARGSAY